MRTIQKKISELDQKGLIVPSCSRLSYSIAAILNGTVIGLASGAQGAAVDSSVDQIQQITVTSQRREENRQDVPITIQALTGETLAELNVATFDEFVRYLPNVTSASNGPGQGNLFMRGLATTSAGVQSSGTVTGFPNVAVYLDDQSVQLSGRNLDVYGVDLERIEVLEGPQGTLFGAGAQAGVIRYITNKPKLDVTEGTVDAGYAYTSHGDPSSSVNATLNLPAISTMSLAHSCAKVPTRALDSRGTPITCQARRRPPIPSVTTVSSQMPSIQSLIRAFAYRPCTRSATTGPPC
jgi:outer membrane receptor protein involved in Fe transport